VDTTDWIHLAINITAATLSTWAAIQSHRAAKQARAHAEQARRNARQAWGNTARTQLATMKIHNLRRRRRGTGPLASRAREARQVGMLWGRR
jgi:hypothetical protein